MQPLITGITSLHKTYTIHQCEKCGSLREALSTKTIDKCAFCDNLDFEAKYISALISFVYDATKGKTTNPTYATFVNAQDAELPEHVTEICKDNPQTGWMVKMQYDNLYVLHSYSCERDRVMLHVQNQNVFGNEQEDFGARWQMAEIIRIWKNILSERIELTA
ncbi:hypothetical protein [Bifidobacterium breve]|uniref:Uncharacterized protein n=1 Tax=Bifidobacterium breve TaxID=1685 RepID=A0A0A0UV88_BIFBR|nr:hypothetical protein [Bifidobacterium breve]AIW55158.1 hypothetical protein B7017_p0104 [Bifidobacterium breve]KOA54466.1 hypothetical protein BBM1454_09220 [Bifidobacterium breve MCC 1454]GDZ57253.1 hypothetical protein MCC01967_01090 [Bifidobacteriaceae bacterium MCC01967]